MPAKKKDATPSAARASGTPQPETSAFDPVSSALAALLPVHSALTLDWLADATATAAEGTLDSAYTFLYLENQEGQLERKSPASDIRRRSLQRALDEFGDRAIPARLDPKDAPAIADALEGRRPVSASAAELFRGLTPATAAEAAQRALGLQAVSLAPLESAGERIGALLLLSVREPLLERVRLVAEHVACAAVNLRQSQTGREPSVADITRSVFDARKLESELQKELARAARYKRVVSIAIVEATNLRLLQEQFGRFLTERLLQRLGGALAEDARDIDVIGLYKTSGYTMVLTEATTEGAANAARRLLGTAERTRLGEEEVPGLELHLVCGWATSPEDGETTDALFAAAERRMYDPSEQVA